MSLSWNRQRLVLLIAALLFIALVVLTFMLSAPHLFAAVYPRGMLIKHLFAAVYPHGGPVQKAIYPHG